MEDLHWADPTTLEFLGLLVDQGPTTHPGAVNLAIKLQPTRTGRSHLTQVTLPRLPRRQAAEMTDRVAHGKALPTEVVAQVVAKTDGVPVCRGVDQDGAGVRAAPGAGGARYELIGPLPPLAIPATLHDSLMARPVAWPQ